MSISMILYQTLCVFSQIKDRKHIEQNFFLLPGMRLWGAGESQKLKRGDLRWRPINWALILLPVGVCIDAYVRIGSYVSCMSTH